jgi:hypothetical protein
MVIIYDLQTANHAFHSNGNSVSCIATGEGCVITNRVESYGNVRLPENN